VNKKTLGNMTDVSKWNLQMYIHSHNRVDTSKTEHITHPRHIPSNFRTTGNKLH